jgi:tetratricopeptide (TPR) repeat protein
MKLDRRRPLFYQRRTSNLYRLFFLVVFIFAGVWFTTRLSAGQIRNPFLPTPTATRTVNSWAMQGDAFFQSGDLNAAIQAYTQATVVDPNNGQIWAELARIQAYSSRLLSNDTDRLARLTEALKSADQAVAVAPDDSMAHAIRTFVLDWNADPALDPLRSNGQTASDLLLEADREGARAVSLDSKNPLALAFQAEVFIDEQNWTQADPRVQQALELGPKVMDVHRVYGYYLESVGNYRQAIEEYQNALAPNPNLTFLYISIGHNYRILAFKSPPGAQQADLYSSALDNYAKAARINEQLGISDPSPYLAIAKTYAQEGEFFAAALNAQKAIALNPTNADLYGQLGNIYKRGRNFETSIIALRCAVSGCTPADSCKARNGCPSGDVGTQVQPLLLNPNSATYYLDLGAVLSAFGPTNPSYCVEAVDILTKVKNAYGSDPIVARNADDGLSICAFVSASLTQTPTPTPVTTTVASPTPVYNTPQP